MLGLRFARAQSPNLAEDDHTRTEGGSDRRVRPLLVGRI